MLDCHPGPARGADDYNSVLRTGPWAVCLPVFPPLRGRVMSRGATGSLSAASQPVLPHSLTWPPWGYRLSVIRRVHNLDGGRKGNPAAALDSVGHKRATPPASGTLVLRWRGSGSGASHLGSAGTSPWANETPRSADFHSPRRRKVDATGQRCWFVGWQAARGGGEGTIHPCLAGNAGRLAHVPRRLNSLEPCLGSLELWRANPRWPRSRSKREGL